MIKKPTIKDIANIVGVSTTTISRYLNGKFENMSEETKSRINEVIIELRYEPSSIARSLKTNKSGMIGLIVSDVMKPFFSMLSKGVSDACTEEGFQLMIANSDNDKFNERKHLKTMKEYNFEGIIINHTGMNLDFLLDLKEEGLKLVLVNQSIDNRSIDSVTTSNREITQIAIKALFEKGYEDIYFVDEPMDNSSVRNEIFMGFRLGHQSYSGDLEAKHVIFKADSLESTFKEICCNYKKRRTAVFCVSGSILLQTLSYFKSRNIRIPEDLGILGFDDLDWTDAIVNGISVIKQPIYKVGREAAKLLIERINGERQANEAVHLILKNTYIERESTQLIK
jgi:LacI family transcriptional regulator, kdg operon repressor